MPCATSSTGSSADPVLLRVFAAAWLCAASQVALAADGPIIAVFPPVDRTGRTAPLEQIHAALESSLSARGFQPLPRTDLDEFIRRHRIRYMGGIPADAADAIGAETGVEAVLITSVDDWETVDPPRFALTSRLVEASPEASLLWMETRAHHGHEQPGAFGLGLVGSVDILIERASDEIAGSLAGSFPAFEEEDREAVARRFRPGIFAVNPDWAEAAASGRPLRVAVLPFVVDAPWRDAGEVLASQFVRWLHAAGSREVLEPGVVRAALLAARVIQEDGPSLPQVDALHALLDLDLVVSGRVTDYEAMGSAPGSPFLGFSARAIDVGTRQAVWSTFSFGRGDDRLGPFGTSRIRSSITLTSGLVEGAVGALDEELRSRRPPRGAAAEKEGNR